MADKKQDTGFTVTDRRLFTTDGEPRPEATEQASEAAAPSAAAAPASPAPIASEPLVGPPDEPGMPTPPTAAEMKEQADAYRQSSKDLDARVELSGHSIKDLEITFERFLASLYMTAMLQLGLMHEQGGQPRIDLVAARQTIDTLSLLQEKTKGNLSGQEDGFLQNCLYELRMAYVDVTNALARPPAPGTATGTDSR